MVLEAVMLCVDNSAYSRNGDYLPTRLKAQTEAVAELAHAKMNSNPETSVGFLSMAGGRIEIGVTPSRDQGKLMTALNRVKPEGDIDLVAALKTAKLCLSHRLNQNQHQRVIVFVGSPLVGLEESKQLTKLAKQFRKEGVAVDIVNFGTENVNNANTAVLESFVEGVNSGENSHLVQIPPGPHILSDLVLTSSIMMQGGGGGNSTASTGQSGPGDALDPSMAMALRMSIEDQKRREEAAVAASLATSGGMDTAEDSGEEESDEEDEDELLAQAIAMSMMSQDASAAEPATTATAPVATMDTAEDDADGDIGQALEDPSFINSLLDDIPGVSADDIGDIWDQLNEDDEQDDANQGE